MKAPDFLALYDDAEFYDAEFATREHEVPFYCRWSARAGGPILEVACGSGRLTLPIAEQGLEIVGLDLSAPMLARARAKSTQRGVPVEWIHQDCRTMELGRTFKLIFSATNAMQHLTDGESIDTFLSAARRHLSNDGRLILDVMNPSVKKLSRTADEPYAFKAFTMPDGRSMEVEARSWYRSDVQQLRFTLTYRHAGEIVRKKDVAMRCFFPEELRALCRHNGFAITQQFGDYDERPITADCAKLILVCSRSD
jgi:2-polyprenyl-3-methyl-5-hydroxy-6-metoxy-1,4-benzoquinol methylase